MSELEEAVQESLGLFEGATSAAQRLTRDTLDRHGLTGSALKVKLNNINYFSTKYLQRPAIRSLRKLLEAIDTLLDSLLDATKFGTALKEIKDVMLNLLADRLQS